LAAKIREVDRLAVPTGKAFAEQADVFVARGSFSIKEG
jgi:hypothetical protein